MTFPDIVNVGCYLAPRKDIASAILLGEYDEESQITSKYKEICCEDLLCPAEMAIQAMQDKGHEKEDISTLIYCHLHYQGGTFLWSPASYLANVLEKKEGVSCFNLNQGCNSLMVALEQTCRQDLIDHRCLLVASDRFDGTGFNRWNSDYGIVYGDAAVSVLLGPEGTGAYAIEALETVWEHRLEALHRFPDIGPENFNHINDIKGSKKSYLNLYGSHMLQSSTVTSVERAICQAMEKSSIRMSDIQHVLLPNLGLKLIESSYLSALGEVVNQVDLSFSQNSGHLGCSDIFAHLHHLECENRINSGDVVLAIGAGAGFSWTACIFRKR
jgi:3-oxoacyl-[acyl-carrier-protein] synthase-3